MEIYFWQRRYCSRIIKYSALIPVTMLVRKDFLASWVIISCNIIFLLIFSKFQNSNENVAPNQ